MGIALMMAAAVAQVGADAKGQAPAPVEVMVLGSYHMDNPGRDLTNARIDPVTTPERQKELEAVAEGLARFRPTAVAVERVASDQQSLVDQGFARFTPAELLRNNDERVQVGYRLAKRAGVTRVYAVDADGDFPFEGVQAWAAANGRKAELDREMAKPAALTERFTAGQKNRSVAQMLRTNNLQTRDGAELSQGNSYYQLLRFGQGKDQPGAKLNAAWYERNAVIFANLLRVAKPGDRILMLYGGGHAYWLRHFVGAMPGYRLVDPERYLPAK